MVQSNFTTLSLDNEIFKSYIFWSSVLIIKMLAMSILTGLQRFRKMAFINPEDIVLDRRIKITTNDPDVERVRRAHLNDMENILPFFVSGFLFILINPSAFVAINIYRTVAILRILHTFVYAVVVIPQPARAIAWGIPYACTIYMTSQTLLKFW